MIGKGLPPWLKGFIIRPWLCIGYPCCCAEATQNCDHCSTGTKQEKYNVTFSGVTNGTCLTCANFNTTTYEVVTLATTSCSWTLDFSECSTTYTMNFQLLDSGIGYYVALDLTHLVSPYGEVTFRTSQRSSPEDCDTYPPWQTPVLYYATQTSGHKCTWSAPAYAIVNKLP